MKHMITLKQKCISLYKMDLMTASTFLFLKKKPLSLSEGQYFHFINSETLFTQMKIT